MELVREEGEGEGRGDGLWGREGGLTVGQEDGRGVEHFEEQLLMWLML